MCIRMVEGEGMTYFNCGKQVMNGKDHIADAVDPDVALQIAEALNRTPYYDRHPDMFSAQPTAIGGGCRAYQASDQMICPCGRQWDVNDPDPPACNG